MTKGTGILHFKFQVSEACLACCNLVLDYRVLPTRWPEENGISQASGSSCRILRWSSILKSRHRHKSNRIVVDGGSRMRLTWMVPSKNEEENGRRS